MVIIIILLIVIFYLLHTPSENNYSYARIKQYNDNTQDIDIKLRKIQKYKKGIKQCEVVQGLMGYVTHSQIQNTDLIKAIDKLWRYSNQYINNRSMYCGFDYCSDAEKRVIELANMEQYIKSIALIIIKSIRDGQSASEVIQSTELFMRDNPKINNIKSY